MDDPTVTFKHLRGTRVDKSFFLKDLALYVYPNNETNKGNLMLFPLPAPIKGGVGSYPGFIVGIGVRPNRSGFVLRASDIRYVPADGDPVAPMRLFGPADCAGEGARGTWHVPPIDPLTLGQNTCTHIAVEFAISPPDPSTRFSVQVGTLRLDDVPYSIPTIQFTPARRLDPFGAP
jgi:hypothetical protein